MVDEQIAESVTGDVLASVTPEQLNQPGSPSEPQAGSAGDEALKHKLQLANQYAKRAEKDADEARKQMQQLRDELEQLKQVQQTAVQKNLEDQGAFKQLWEDTKKTVATKEARILELEAQLESVTQSAQQERLKAAATAQISQANAVNPTQLYQLLASQLRTDAEGNAVVIDGGVEQPLQSYLNNLKQSADWQHHFSSTGAIGMGASAASVAPGMTNPYRTGNLTEALLLEASNPDLAKALKAEAQRG